ncbi:MAG TPA: hypothetical protein VF583_15880, partial [Bradyrhizobium sp.]
MIGLIARTCALAALALLSTVVTGQGAGTSVTQPISRFDNWTVEENKTLPKFQENFPDSVRAIGSSTVPGISIELRCLTRSVDPDISTYAINVHLGSVNTPKTFEVVLSSGSAQFKVLMLTLPGRQSYSLKLHSDTFQDVFRSFAADHDLGLSFVSSSGQ